MAPLPFDTPHPARPVPATRLPPLRDAVPGSTDVATPHAAAEHSFDSAWQLGWDHARHGLTPPLERLCINPRLQQGFRAARAQVGRRTVPAGPDVLAWLALRLQALAGGIAYETVTLTPRHLARLSVSHCPVTRERLGHVAHEPAQAVITRLRLDAGYAAGHLAMMSRRAEAARGRLDLAALRDRARRGLAQPHGAASLDGLSGTQWARLATLASLVVPLPHDEAARLPMPVLPPARLRLFNSVQALQALVCRALLHPTPNRQLARIREALPPAAPHREAFDRFLVAYRAAVDQQAFSRPAGLPAWALEDAWGERQVLVRWQRLARALTPAECEAAVAAAGGRSVCLLPEALALDGWAIETGGRAPGRRIAAAPRLLNVPRPLRASPHGQPPAAAGRPMPPAAPAARQIAMFPLRG